MKAAFIALAALPLLAAAPASAESAYARKWIDATAAEIGARVQPAPAAGTVTLRASVGGSRRLESVELAGASGSPALDRAVLDAARRYRGETPPSDLVGRVVLLRVKPAEALAAADRGPVARR